ncbi:glycoside hydrolase family 31 protein [Tilletiaria anomala UBC 951]|uniref:Glucosidase II subunit alpha n=1 Tax=Tilletiaria anomala (strain ATCC 24038 / CBS 436.72 / UBC 951) TaxID=1037660 RepID=A0A066W348_TILAU|nr:glycoside hydrolase family 31 protein [Tilletiaria anomala UBC 951]KDN46968.1 glycoside hydrolase family 31 protein [Tilletiaria anomala UBC 951]
MALFRGTRRSLAKGRAITGTTTLTLLTVFLLTALALVPTPTAAVRHHEFKTCSQSSFCRRLRRLSSYVASFSSEKQGNGRDFPSPYSLSTALPLLPEHMSFNMTSSTLKARIFSALYPDEAVFELQLRVHADGTARVRVDDAPGIETHNGWKRYDEAPLWTFENAPEPAALGTVQISQPRPGVTALQWHGIANASDRQEPPTFMAEVQHAPFKVTFLRDGAPQIVLNDRALLHMEHFRPKPDSLPSIQPPSSNDDEKGEQGESDGEDVKLVIQNSKRDVLLSRGYAASDAEKWKGFEVEDEGEWEETFSGRLDTKPKGPEAISLDISFIGYSNVYGIPEHASPLALRSTHGKAEEDYKDPYRLFNLDVFEYEHDSPMSLYGAIPVMHAQKKDEAVSVFWLNAAETWIDIQRDVPSAFAHGSKGAGKAGSSDTQTHWMSESGVLDLLVYLEPAPSTNLALFTAHTGRTALPQLFALGYHQCRWNYLSTADVLQVNERFDKEDIPMDVMWLDIEYSKDHMYGVWNLATFPTPEKMLEGLDAVGRKLVIIIDPHLKRTRDYFLYAEAQDHSVLVQNGPVAAPATRGGEGGGTGEYEGWCWSGSASWLDMFHPSSWQWYKDVYKLPAGGAGGIQANARNLHIWNDMNEPSVFNGPEITCPKDVVHYGGWENRDLHNINGVLFHNNTAQALVERELATGGERRRPFVLSRSFWAGSQRFGAVWTGDNLGDWEHLAISVPMMLSVSLGGMSFVGSDVGGFFGNPSPEMLVRWYQSGIFMPFFRAHAHIDTKRREPYLLDEPLRSHVRDLIKLRYKHLPVWYTAFKESAASGLPVIRPQYLVFPGDTKGFDVDDQYYIGDSGLLVKPPVEEKQENVQIYIADDQPYYHYFSHGVYYPGAGGKYITVPAPLDGTAPLLHQGGSILPIRERERRSAELGSKDPITLIVALGKPASSAQGKAQSQNERATGVLYLDDGQTYEHERGSFIWRRFSWRTDAAQGTHVLAATDESVRRGASSAPHAANAFAQAIKDVRVERIVVLGLEKEPRSIRLVRGGGSNGDGDAAQRSIQWKWSRGATASSGKKLSSLLGDSESKASELVIKDPGALITEDFVIELQ